MRGRGRRRKQLLEDLKEGKGYCNLKEETQLALEETTDLRQDRLGNEFYLHEISGCTELITYSEILTLFQSL
jgi:hypothetical protein